MSNQPLSDKEPSLHETNTAHNEPALGGDHWVAHFAPMLDSPQWSVRAKAIAGLAQVQPHRRLRRCAASGVYCTSPRRQSSDVAR
jgi:hypothetical protein